MQISTNMSVKRKSTHQQKEDHFSKRRKLSLNTQDLGEMDKTHEPRNNSLFRLQIESILEEIQTSEKEIVQVQNWIQKFSSKVKGFPSSKVFELANLSWIEKEKLKVPLDLADFSNLKGEFRFEPPTDISICGAFASRTSLKTDRSLDIMLLLPRNVVKKTDFNNGIWFLKRALYLAWLAKALDVSGDYSKLEWTLQFDSLLRPILQLKTKESCKKWTMNIFPVPPHDHIKLAKIGPLRNNVDSSWFFEKKWREEKADTTPTPYLNWLLGVDLLMKNHADYIAKHLISENLRKGIKLIKVWAKQRYYNQGNSYLNGHVITMYVLYLLNNRTVSGQMSPYIVFRTTLLAIIKESWIDHGPSFLLEWKREYEKQDFHNSAEVVFVEPNGYLNLTTPMLADVFHEIQRDCSKVIETLEHVTETTFEALFIDKIDSDLKWDEVIRVRLPLAKIKHLAKSSEDKAYVLSHFGLHPKKVWLQIISKIKLGLDERINSISISRKCARKFDYRSLPEPMETNIDLYLSYNETYTGLITKGPPGDSPQAREFRDFWGEKSQLWRFPDGSMNESVVWGKGGDPMFLRRRIPLNTIKYLLKKYFDIPNNQILSKEEDFDAILKSPIIFKDAQTSTGEEYTIAAIQVFDDFKRLLQSLNLPLKIHKVASSSAFMRHTSVFSPVGLSCESKDPKKKQLRITDPEFSHYRESIGMIIFFESSNKWADELLPLRALKVQFMCTIADILEKKKIKTIVFRDHMSIFWKGYSISLKIGVKHEIGLLRKLKESQPKNEDVEDPLAMEMDIEVLPLLTSHLKQLQSTYPNFSNSVRLAKRWVASQLLLPYFPPLLVELLVAHIFLNNTGYGRSRSGRVGFLRFLHLVSRVDWKNTPFILDFTDSLTENDRQEVSTLFEDQRDTLPNVFVFTSCEKSKIKDSSPSVDMTAEEIKSVLPFSKSLTGEGPILPILARAKILATSTLQIYESERSGFSLQVKSLFRPSFDGFDMIINLKTDALSRKNEAIDFDSEKTENTYEPSNHERVPAADLDPASKYAEQLRNHYGEHALFLHDPHGGSRIAVALRPEALKSRECKPLTFNGHKLHKGDTEQILNLEAIVQDFKILGAHICKSVITTNENI